MVAGMEAGASSPRSIGDLATVDRASYVVLDAARALDAFGTSEQARGNEPARDRPRRSYLVVAFDVLAVGESLLAGTAAVSTGFVQGAEPATTSVGAWPLAFVPVFIAAFAVYGMYHRDRRRLFPTTFPDLFFLSHALLVVAAVMLCISHAFHNVVAFFPRFTLGAAIACTAPCLLTLPVMRTLRAAIAGAGGRVRSRIVILGSGTVANSIARRLGCFDDVELLGFVDDPGDFDDDRDAPHLLTKLGTIAELPTLCRLFDVDRVIVAFSAKNAADIADELRALPTGVKVSVVPQLFELLSWRSSVEEVLGLPVIDVAPPVLSRTHRFGKRTLDLAVAGAAIVVTAPVWLAVAAAIKLTSHGPVVFKQERVGKGGSIFEIYKFRTMRTNAESDRTALASANEVDGPLFKIRSDPRVTRIGRVLRATSLDELPQLLNILKGDMSLVGPRPFVVAESNLIDGWAVRRLEVRPGMTGLWQISGRNDLPFEELRRLDYAYVASWSIWWDLKILWHTPACILRRRGAY
jgi:exopolysaccharide biosynthesis polyprenyl glycosylphosphotransferase